MKNFAISLITLAAISTASFAASFATDKPHELYSSGAGYPQLNDNSSSSNAFAVAGNWTTAPTAAEIMIMNAIENERNNNDK